ncbi:MAG: heme ABC transporter permease CcmC [Gammaproteobacteria bacterium]|nr:heme ABC transporter permease CcmC [Gammaproteobacteria bacterium]
MNFFTKAFWLKLSSPKTFYPFAGKMIPVFMAITVVLTLVGLYYGFVLAPPDYQQGDSYRIMFIHVPAAWMSMWIYIVMCLFAIIGMVWRTRLSDMMAGALAPTGAMFAFLALWTGALWGKPTWGAYWVWDARLTSELILLFLFFGFIALRAAIDDPQRAARASALLASVGVINVPIIYFSVKWWNTLHQGSSVGLTQKATMEDSMLTAMMVMTFAFWAYTFMVAFMRVRNEILEREKNSAWVTESVTQRVSEKVEGK